MKKLLPVTFEWKEDFATSSGASHLLVTKIGTIPLTKVVRLFADERGFYNGDENPPVFTPNLRVARKRVEDQLLSDLKATT